MRKANPYTRAALGSARAVPPPPEPAPSERTVLGIIPSVQANSAPVPVAAAQDRHRNRGNGLRSTNHWAVPTAVPSTRVPAKTASTAAPSVGSTPLPSPTYKTIAAPTSAVMPKPQTSPTALASTHLDHSRRSPWPGFHSTLTGLQSPRG